ncbi:MAG TPA: type I secretion C-terminal target domain-containing protein [Acetobacteraceae bacterium]|nr:type I secretion C-terminal target domain-containing protein [Acetobacteraceae bacterium]
MTANTAITADDFLGTLGINTHIGDVGAYSDLSQVEQNLEYLGVGIDRDSTASASGISALQQVSQAAGVKFDVYMPEGAPAWDQDALALVPQMAADGILHAIEGGNEEDDSYAQANGNSLSWTAQFQQQVYEMGQQVGLPVINMSFGAGWTAANNWEGDYPDVGDLSADTNYANAHTYPNVGETPNAAIEALNADAELAASSQPVITTEIGWQTSQFSETQIAQYVVDATFDGIADGDAGMYFYGLYDDSSGDWGLFNSDGTPRPAATALHDLTTLLADPGSNAASFTPGSLNYSLSGTQSGDNSILIEKSDGSFWIGLWNEGGGEHTVTVNLPSPASEVEVFDPVTGTSAIESASNTSSVSVSLGGDPLLIEDVPGGSSAASDPGTTTTAPSTSGTSGADPGSSTGTSDPGTTTTTGTGSTANSANDLSVAVPGSETVAAGTTQAISGVSVSDPSAAAAPGNMALNVWDNSGTLTIEGQTFGPGGGSVPYGMFSGSLAQINADLATLQYTAGSNSGSDTITIDVWNQSGVEVTETVPVTIGTGPGSTGSAGNGSASTSTTTGSSTGSTTASGNGTSVTATAGGAAGTPTDLSLTVPSSETVAAGAAQTISGVSVSDPWAAGNGGDMALNVWDNSGTLTIDGQPFGPGGGPVPYGMFSGSLAQINADLASMTYTAPAAGGSDAITVDVWNQAGVDVTETIAVSGTGSSGSSETTPPSNAVTIAANDANPVEIVNNTAITATAGDHMLFIGGTGNTATLSGGTDTVQAFQGNNSIATTGGNDTIQISGSGNVVNASGGNVTIDDGGTGNTIVMPAAGNGNDDIFGYLLQNGDTLDLRAALASTTWNGSENTLGNYLSISSSNDNATISLSPTGTGPGSAIATLQGSGPVTLATLLQHAIT